MNKKYELFKEKKSNTLFRIRALRDFSDVKAGDVGGFIEKESNLSHEGDCWVYDNAWVSGDAKVYGDAQVYDYAQVYGNAKVYGDAWVSGYARVSDNARVYGNAKVYDNAIISQCMRIQYGHVTSTPDKITLLKHSLGIFPVNGEVILYKRVNSDLSSEHNRKFIYPEQGWVEEPNTDIDPSESCSSGLHFSHLYYSSWTNSSKEYKFLAARICVDDIIAVQEGKVRCKKAFILGVDTHNQTCYNTPTTGETKMKNKTRYAVIALSTGKVLKNAVTREEARNWKRSSAKNGLGIIDRNSNSVIS